MPRVYKYRSKFTAIARCTLDADMGKFISQASLQDLKSILPPDAEEFPDLLAIAGNACVINLGNANGDMADTEVGVELFKQFVHKPINLEHDEGIILGHATHAALTEYNPAYSVGAGSKVVSADDVKGKSSPFNIAIGGYLYRARFPDVARKVLMASDPSHPTYMDVSFSWELAFDDYKLFVGSGSRDEGEVISDPEKIAAWASCLRCNKGSGTAPDGRPLYRLVSWAKLDDGSIDSNSIYAMGVALTLAPAGAVAGIATSLTTDKPENNIAKASENISHQPIINVTTNTTRMKLFTSIDEITGLNDEKAKEYSFANIGAVLTSGIGAQLQEAIAAKSKEWMDKIKEKEDEAKDAKDKADAALIKVAELEKAAASTNAELETLKQQQAQAAAAQVFNQRMAHLDSEYELTADDRKALAKRINGLDEEAFASVLKDELVVLLAPKNKAAIAAKQTAVASTTATTDAAAAQAAQAALANASTAAATVPNTTQATPSFVEKYKNAFALGTGVIVGKPKK